jgi:hypothetical protein
LNINSSHKDWTYNRGPVTAIVSMISLAILADFSISAPGRVTGVPQSPARFPER